MELLQLKYFLEVARLEHMTDAARSLHVTQSSLSKTIGRLEEDLGVLLFDRIGRKLRLNEFGSRFYRRAERALFELEQGKQEISFQPRTWHTRIGSDHRKHIASDPSRVSEQASRYPISCANAHHAGNGYASS